MRGESDEGGELETGYSWGRDRVEISTRSSADELAIL